MYYFRKTIDKKNTKIRAKLHWSLYRSRIKSIVYIFQAYYAYYTYCHFNFAFHLLNIFFNVQVNDTSCGKENKLIVEGTIDFGPCFNVPTRTCIYLERVKCIITYMIVFAELGDRGDPIHAPVVRMRG